MAALGGALCLSVAEGFRDSSKGNLVASFACKDGQALNLMPSNGKFHSVQWTFKLLDSCIRRD